MWLGIPWSFAIMAAPKRVEVHYRKGLSAWPPLQRALGHISRAEECCYAARISRTQGDRVYPRQQSIDRSGAEIRG